MGERNKKLKNNQFLFSSFRIFSNASNTSAKLNWNKEKKIFLGEKFFLDFFSRDFNGPFWISLQAVPRALLEKEKFAFYRKNHSFSASLSYV